MATVPAALVASAVISAGVAVYSASQKPKINTPKQPTAVGTGEILKVKTSDELEEEDVKVRDTVKKASNVNAQFQVQLDKKTTGLNVDSTTSLNV